MSKQPPSYSYPKQSSSVPGANPPSYTPGGHPQSSYPTQSGSNPAVYHGKFDAGARFSGGATANVPPAPPGYPPNTAQIAAMQGQTVHMTQEKSGVFSTKSDGGTTTHFD